LNPAAGTDAGQPATIVPPHPERLFRQRAARLRELAASVPSLSGYLLLMAELAERQASIMTAPPANQPAADYERNPGAGHPDSTQALSDVDWGDALTPLLPALLRDFPAPSAAVEQALHRITEADGVTVNRWVADLRSGQPLPDDIGLLPFIAAALQVELARWSAALQPDELGRPTEPGRCPVCAGWPVASILRTVVETPGLRYLHCGFCASEWLYPRIQCVHCGSGEQIAYHGIEGGDQAVQAETCETCHSYLKRIDRDKSPGADPLADDLASLALEVLMGEAGYLRSGLNPWLPITNPALQDN
jgi:FdhE protein